MAEEAGKTELIDQPTTDTRTPPPYRVILHNDDVNVRDYVIETIYKLTPLTIEQATEKTSEADRNGLAILLVCHKERAELYQEQFQSCRLTVTIEPD